MAAPSVLVIGARGQIGAALSRCLESGGSLVRGTAREGEAGLVALDLAAAAPSVPGEYNVAAMCAGITSIAACRIDPEGTGRINVKNSLDVLRQVAARGAFVVTLSTNLVFDGSKSNRLPTDSVCPGTEYGRQKALLEEGVLGLGGAVVRLTKVVGNAKLYRGWVSDLKAGKVIRPFADMFMAPIPLEPTVQALASVILKCTPGIFQLSAVTDISYAGVAEIMCRAIAADPKLVRPMAAPVGVPAEERPRYTSLDTARAEEELGWRSMRAEETMAEITRR